MPDYEFITRKSADGTRALLLCRDEHHRLQTYGYGFVLDAGGGVDFRPFDDGEIDFIVGPRRCGEPNMFP